MDSPNQSKRRKLQEHDVKEVKVADPWHQPDCILKALDDDFLRMILLNLNQMDLTKAANVCLRFNQQAKVVFSTKYGNKLDLTQCTMEGAKPAIRTFGSLAHFIDFQSYPATKTCIDAAVVYGPENNPEILYMIDSCCTSALSELKLIDFNEDDPLYYDSIPESAFKTLKKLVFSSCELTSGVRGFLALCSDLKILHFEKSLIYDDFKMLKFEKLEELRVNLTKGFGDASLTKFTALNPNLLKISLDSRGRVSIWKTPRIIAKYSPKLIELEFANCSYDDEFAEDILDLGKLSALKVLKLALPSAVSAKQLIDVLTANNIAIEQLEIHSGKFDEDAIESLSKMEKLKILKLSDTLDFADKNMIELAKVLGPQLEKLEFENPIVLNITKTGLKEMLPFAMKVSYLTLKSAKLHIDEDDYSLILGLIKKRPENIGLTLELSGPGNQVNVSEKKLLGNRDTFNVKEVVDTSNKSDNDDHHYLSSDSDDGYNYDYDYDSD